MTKEELFKLMNDRRHEISTMLDPKTYLLKCVEIMFDVSAEAVAAKLRELDDKTKGAQ